MLFTLRLLESPKRVHSSLVLEELSQIQRFARKLNFERCALGNNWHNGERLGVILQTMAHTEVGCGNYTWFMDRNEFLKPFAKFVDEREWAQFHSVQNLAKSISIDSAELADVLTHCFIFPGKVVILPTQLIPKNDFDNCGKISCLQG